MPLIRRQLIALSGAGVDEVVVALGHHGDVIEAALRDEWLAGDADAACRRWREAHPERVHWFDTDNRRYRVDIDTPDDLKCFTERTGHELRWPAALTAV